MALIVLSAAVHAQPENAPTYKCVTGGKVTYTDAPCVGGKLVDTTPTQGFGRMSSPSPKGTGTRKSRRHKPAAEVSNPFFDQVEEESTQAIQRRMCRTTITEETGLAGKKWEPTRNHNENRGLQPFYNP